VVVAGKSALREGSLVQVIAPGTASTAAVTPDNAGAAPAKAAQ
jgi:hypothetical protein